MESSLYIGTLRHRRFAPRPHAFDYRLFMALLDIDRIPELMRVSPLAGHNRRRWASFDDRDHFGDPAQPLRQRLQTDAATNGIELPDGKIFLLTHLRYLGYGFNPVSFYYCCDRAGEVRMMLAEVSNTFGESHNYWLHRTNETPVSGAHRYRTAKVFHVSPFMSLEYDYTWLFTDPGERLVAHMQNLDGEEIAFDATLTLERRDWTAPNLHRALAKHPWMTAKVFAGIHWQALRLWLRGFKVFTHPGRLRWEDAMLVDT